MSKTIILEKIQQSKITFPEVISFIDENYHFIPTAFQNGLLQNLADENNGSCKIIAFSKLNNLSKSETLACFGAYYFEDVLGDLEGTNHQNIRNFMKFGWEGIQFENEALIVK